MITRFKKFTAIIALAFIPSFAIVACTDKQVGAITSGVGNAVACVLQHDQLPPEQIVAKCSGTVIEDVIEILKAHRNAMARASCAPQPDAGEPRSINIGPGK